MTEQIHSEGRLRRIVQFPLVRIIIAFLWMIAISAGTQSLLRLLPAGGTLPVSTISMIINAAVVYLSYLAFVRIVEKRTVQEFETAGAISELAGGVAMGALLFSAVAGILWTVGCFTITGVNPWIVMIPTFTVSVFVAVFEEVLFRAILFRILEEWLGTWFALFFSAALFGGLHLANSPAHWYVSIEIAIEAGLLLAAAYLLTRRLWLVMGLHFAWNFVEGGIFSVSVSGGRSTGLFQCTLTGPEWLTGGKFGVEASIVAVLICAAAAVYLIGRAKKSGGFMWPRKVSGVRFRVSEMS